MTCQRATSAVAWIHNHQGLSALTYLDDFIGVQTESEAPKAFHSLANLLRELGLRENVNKACQPATIQTCLGVQFDTVKLTLSITPQRLADILTLSTWTAKTSARKQELQSLVGSLVFISNACVKAEYS